MAVLLQKSIFIHVPRTGGQWVRSVLRKAYQGIEKEVGDSHCSVRDLDKDLLEKYKTFGFVRHPANWVMSRWSHLNAKKELTSKTLPKLHKRFHDVFVKDSFQKTVENIIENDPNLVCDTFDKQLQGCDFIGRLEDQPRSLSLILKCCSERFNPNWATSVDPINQSSKRKLVLSTKVNDKFLRSNQAILDRWYSNKWDSNIKIWIRG